MKPTWMTTATTHRRRRGSIRSSVAWRFASKTRPCSALPTCSLMLSTLCSSQLRFSGGSHCLNETLRHVGGAPTYKVPIRVLQSL